MGPLDYRDLRETGSRTFRAFLAPLQRKLEFRPRGIFDAAVGQVRIIWFVRINNRFVPLWTGLLKTSIDPFLDGGGGRGRGEGRGRGVEPVMALTL